MKAESLPPVDCCRTQILLLSQMLGLGFSPSTIGFTLSSSGLISASMQVFVMPIILKRVEASKLYNISISAYPIVFATLPVLNVIARGGAEQEIGNLGLVSNIMLWGTLTFIIAASKVGGMAYSLTLMLTRTNTYSPAALSVSNGVMSCAMSLGRMISPALACSIFALSGEYHLLGGYLWSLCMVCSSLTAVVLARNISRLSRSSLTHYSRNQQ
ncbi:hypothetical protein BDP27DRAFT_1337714 [Rhodocollybia butyracea]|uniref:MFS transporter n=1 Tax=Rhodocollybia butyracea TaxID=206335 RepID=A0A9P5PE19_9AGAR|nr:hypothetical protein BDP27DRAFT_1337714 [Rhodocollybia butyracea]